MAKIKTLRRCSLFRVLSYRDLAVLAPFVKEETAEANSWIAEEGKPTRGLVVLKKGRMRIISGLTQGAEVEISMGDFFGELSLADGDQTRAIGAQAIEACEFLRIDPRDFHTLCKHSPDVAGKLAQGIMSLMSQKVVGMRAVLHELLQLKPGG